MNQARTSALVILVACLSSTAGRAAGQSGLELVPEQHRSSLESFAADVRGCLASQAPSDCLAPLVVERVYFPWIADLTESAVCRAIYEEGIARDGHGWYASSRSWARCVLDAPHPVGYGNARPDGAQRFVDEVEACFEADLEVLQAGYDSARARVHASLDGIAFFCDVIWQHRWRIEAVHPKP